MIDLKEIQNKVIKKENLYFLLIILLIFLSDRYTKNTIINKFNESTYYINDFLNFDLMWNTGIGFGLLKFDSSVIYNLISTLIAGVIIFLILLGLKSEKFDKIIFSLIVGGAIGNFYDRLIYKAVPDFIDFHLESFHWFTFNVADIFITIGVILFLIEEIFIKK